MTRTGFITLIGLALGLLMNGQNKTITATDLHGNWVLELNKNEPVRDEFIFKRQKPSENRRAAVTITITLLEFDECLVDYDERMYCGNVGRTDYSWAFDNSLGIINIYRSEKWLRAFKEENPDEFKSLDVPDKYHEMELSLTVLKNGGIGLEIMNWE
ncbi:hypothetical protein [Maribacter sp. 2307UL18-2]|uniref:hypothetical protein n=1 Tax=Maribacter sp. 2307UL18-2 TaxID=3386274 RepID=UPI0039BD5F90